MILGIIGGGVVGHATARAFIEHVDEVRVYDKEPGRRTTEEVGTIVQAGPYGLKKPDLVFICLPETVLDTFLGNLPYGWDRNLNYVLKSTVPIGTTRRLREQFQLPNLVHSPEFLTARCAVTDAQLPARNVIGQPFYDVIWDKGSDTCPAILYDLYKIRFPGTPIHCMDSNESEAVKLFQNGFFAVKVAYWNEVRTLADKLGLDWDAVIAAILADGRIAHSHTKVPGPDGRRGFGGTCLPKDVNMLYELLMEHDLYAGVTLGAIRRNVIDRPPEVKK